MPPNNLTKLKKRVLLQQSIFTTAIDKLSVLLLGIAPTSDELKATVTSCENVSISLKTLNSELVDLLLDTDDDAALEQEQLFFDLNNKFLLLKEKVNSHLKNNSLNTNANNCVRRTPNLPKLGLPKFSGNILEYRSFIERFDSAVHNDPSLDEIEKFNYLLSLLSEGAARCLKGMDLTAKNYLSSRDILKKRYGNSNRVIRAHVRELLSIQLQSKFDKDSIRVFADKVISHIRSLSSLEVTSDKYSCILSPIILSKLPYKLCEEWAKLDEEENSSIDELIKFLDTKATSMEYSSELASSAKTPVKTSNNVVNNTKPFQNVFNNSNNFNTIVCIMCKGNHYISRCHKYLKLNARDKYAFIKEQRCCFNCLGKHFISACTSNSSCRECNRKHHTTLHEAIVTANQFKDKESSRIENTVQHHSSNSDTTLLCTAITTAFSKDKERKVRLMFDSGSQSSYILKKVSKELQCEELSKNTLSVSAFGGCQKTLQTRKVKVNLKNGKDMFPIQCYESEELCSNVPSLTYSQSQRLEKSFKDLLFCDTDESIKKKVDIIVGMDFYHDFITGKVKRSQSGLLAMETVFGWSIVGKRTKLKEISCISTTKEEDKLIEDFEKIVKKNIEVINDEEDEVVEKEKEAGEKLEIEKMCDGRYQVKWPWNQSTDNMLSNESVAKRRFITSISRYKASEEMMQSYNDYFMDQLERNFIEKAPVIPTGPLRYLPHHAVIKQDALKTKLRVVLDSSCKDYNSKCLNDYIDKGSNNMGNIYQILNHFRKHEIGMIADIEKAFLQISLEETQRDCVRFYWYDTEPHKDFKQNQVIPYRMKRLSFGVNASPFVLNFTIQKQIETYKDQYENAAKILKNSFYMDDLVISVDSYDKAKSLYCSTKAIFADMKMNIRGWTTNDKQYQKFLVNEKEEDMTKDGCAKVLGVNWSLNEDKLTFELSFPVNGINSKRQLMKFYASIWDPIGILAPQTICIKQLLQSCWTKDITWDQSLPDDISKELSNLQRILSPKLKVDIPRSVNLKEDTRYEIHAFGDASLQLICGVVYVKVIVEDDILVYFIRSRTKVISKKNKQTLPRLELCATVLASDLLSWCKEIFQESVASYLHSDSQIVISWVGEKADKWKPYIARRVKVIQNNMEGKRVHYVPGEMNPADCSTRVLKRVDDRLWNAWLHPTWLKSKFEETVVPDVEMSLSALEKENADSKLPAVVIPYERFSSLRKLIRVVAYVIRFIKHGSKIEQNETKLLNSFELERSEEVIVRTEQMLSFGNEITSIQKEQTVEISSPISALLPFVDSTGILRMRSRMDNSSLTYDEKYPIILHHQSQFVRLLVNETHNDMNHASVRQVLFQIRKRFWITKGRKTITQILKKCCYCLRRIAKPYDEMPAPLPLERTTDEPKLPFYFVGIDYCGPFYINNETKKKCKCYILLITCTRIRAVHLEITDGLDQRSTFNAIERFISRRGIPKVIFSDNDLTFRSLQTIMLSKYRTIWKYTTPASPWHGGHWERLVRMVKECLRPVMRRSIHSHDEFQTLVYKSEAIINSRPITAVFDSFNEPMSLSPSDFLLGRSLILISKDNNIDIKPIRFNKSEFLVALKLNQNILKDLWSRWKLEYLRFLRTGYRYTKSEPIKIDDIVLVEDIGCKELWPIARVIKLHPGKDGNTRSVSILKSNKKYDRPIQKLYKLEFDTIE